MKISTVITYCTLDQRFIDHCIKQAAYFSDEIVVAYADKLYDGTPEDKDLIFDAINRNPTAKFVRYDPADAPVKGFNDACQSRWAGFHALQNNSEWVLFLDADEIIDGERFKRDISGGDSSYWSFCKCSEHNYVNFMCNWYFRSPRNQALTRECAGTIVRREFVLEPFVFNKLERWGFRQIPRGIHGFKDNDELPYVHHYSWVRSKEEMLHKVKGWGHKNDKDWVTLVNQEFEHEFTGKDFVHNYKYRDVEPFIEVGL